MTTNPPSVPSFPGGKPAVLCSADCQKCAKRGLPWVAVIDTVVDKSDAARLAQAGHSYPAAFDAGFASFARTATVPAAWLPGAGFVWVLYEDIGRWDIWQTFADGSNRMLLQKVSSQDYAKQSPGLKPSTDGQVCARGAANLGAGFFTISGAISHRSVWLAYTAHLLAPAVLKAYTTDAHGQRTQRMTQVLAQAWVQGGPQPPRSLLLSEATLKTHVAEYADAPPGGPVTSPLVRAFEKASRRFNPHRLGRAKDMQAHACVMEQASGQACKDRALIIRLRDDIGVADELNHIRLQTLSARQGWMAGDVDAQGRNADPQRPWKRQSLLHAGYIREWVKSKERAVHQDRVDQGLYRRHVVISDFEYRKIQEHERLTGDTVNPPGTAYEKLPGAPERWRVTFPEQQIQRGIDELAAASSKGRIERYNAHLDQAAIDLANQAWQAAETGWVELMARRDQDYVQWIQGAPLQAALRYDFDNKPALSEASRTSDEVRSDVQEAAARLAATARCYGGGACSDASLKMLIEQFKKDEKDKTHFIAQAMIGEFEALDKFIATYQGSPGTRADLYDSATASRGSWEQFQAAWQQVRDQASAASDTLTQVALQVTQRMRQLALMPATAQQRGLVVKLQEAAQKQVVWARAAGFSAFVNQGIRQYLVGVRWHADAFAAAGAELTLALPAVDARERASGGKTGKQARKARLQTSAELRAYMARQAGNAEATIMLVIDQNELGRAAQARGERMLDVVTPGLFGLPQGVVSIPESLAERIVRERQSINMHNLKNAATVLNMGVFYLQALAVAESWENIAKKGGQDQVDAVASLLGGLTGLAGAGSELAALMLAPAAANAAGAPLAAELASRVPAYLRWKFAAGLFMAAGAVFDAGVAFAKARKFGAQGDEDASRTAYGVFGSQLTGGLAIGLGQYHAYRAAILQRLHSQAGMRLLASAFSPLQLSRTLTGVGLLLWLAGLGLSFYALYLEDDANESFLRRSFFGKGHPQLGKFTDLDHEVQSFGALAVGTSAELEWHDNWTQADEFTVRVKVFNPQPGSVVTAVVEGFEKINGRKVSELYKGDMPSLVLEGNTPLPNAAGAVHVTERRRAVPNGIAAIRLTYALYENRAENAWPTTRGELWIED
jgi:hypothetical protein